MKQAILIIHILSTDCPFVANIVYVLNSILLPYGLMLNLKQDPQIVKTHINHKFFAL